MKDILLQIIAILKEMGYEKDKTTIIINPLDNEQQAKKFLNWLKENRKKMDYMDMVEIAEKM